MGTRHCSRLLGMMEPREASRLPMEAFFIPQLLGRRDRHPGCDMGDSCHYPGLEGSLTGIPAGERQRGIEDNVVDTCPSGKQQITGC